MFGTALSVPVPDLDRTDYLLILGANPFVSNGSLMTAPDVPGRLRAHPRARRHASSSSIRAARAPPARPTSTTSSAPAPTRYFLFAIVHTLFAEGLVRLGPPRRARRRRRRGRARWRATSRPRRSRPRCGIAGRRHPPARARARRGAERAAVYGRIGTCTQEFGTLASWLVDVVNVLTGNLDRARRRDVPEGRRAARRTRAATPGRGKGVRFGRRHEPRARRARRSSASCPAACLAEEIETPGDGQIRALITDRRQPGAEHAERRAARRARSRRSTSW